ncbi:HAMP domain-containing histidine kinase [Flavobacterium supellecticarium]|uniref:histidine kinase n=1 Tax=Flavobacterium supellecticarium TaxID=2565924 RepID=A0A4S4A3B1_9FLAO|nr:HAMP domain-containing sensor histidine kinase [Flavobacterium supellecticarium]THF52901.1 HAMP domain-containing histidine kinase [Flavobacterium supellecticarium]
MTLKRRIAVNVSIAFSVIYGISAIFIYISFSTFRKEEFMERLEEKALTTTKLLLEVKDVDNQILKLIDQNTINKLYNEKTLIFDSNYKLIYSSIDDASVKWDVNFLQKIKKHKRVYTIEKEKDVLGVFHIYNNTDYYIIIAAEDKSGMSKLEFLYQILILSFFIGTTLVWVTTYFLIRKSLEPLDNFQKIITSISINKLNTQIIESSKSDEINLLSKAFNQMLLRIERSYLAQKEFTSNASHELRTPISRLTLQLENLIQQGGHNENTLNYLNNMSKDVNQISDLINSLLLLAQINASNFGVNFQQVRIDEIIFQVYEKTIKNFPDFQMNFEIENTESDLEIKGITSLLEIVFANLFKNAYLYSYDRKVNVIIEDNPTGNIQIRLINKGEKLSPEEEKKIFNSFVRGTKNQKIQGSGLGLRIAKRILDLHKAKLAYAYEDASEQHEFTLTFPV